MSHQEHVEEVARGTGPLGQLFASDAGMAWPSDVTLSRAAIKPGKARDLILVFVGDRVDTKWIWLSAAQRHHAILVHSYCIGQIQPLLRTYPLIVREY